jgi:hypothetical protein
LNLKYVSATEDSVCANPKCKEELMRAINAAVPKSSVWKVASVLLLPVLIGFAVVYSVVTTADTKYAREVEVKVLAAQLGFMTMTMNEVKHSVAVLNSNMMEKLEEIRKQQIDLYKQIPKGNTMKERANGQTSSIN